MTAPAILPDATELDNGITNGRVPWRTMIGIDQWDWHSLRELCRDEGFAEPRVAVLGSGRCYNPPQIRYAWVADGAPAIDVRWLWRYENGPIDWQAVMAAADDCDVVVAAPNYVGETSDKQDRDNQYNAEFVHRMSQNGRFRGPFQSVAREVSADRSPCVPQESVIPSAACSSVSFRHDSTFYYRQPYAWSREDGPYAAVSVSVVVPVYQGERTLRPLIKEIEPFTAESLSPQGTAYCIREVILVHDGAVDDSAPVMEALAANYFFVRLVWLSRNFGQHPATLAGMASSTGEWIVTVDEDGQQDLGTSGGFSTALSIRRLNWFTASRKTHRHTAGCAINSAGWRRPFSPPCSTPAASATLTVSGLLTAKSAAVWRPIAARTFISTWLWSWCVARTVGCPILVRNERGRALRIRLRPITRPFCALMLTSGTRPLRLIAGLGGIAVLMASAIAGYAVYEKLTAQVPVQGWTSMIVVTCFFAGCILLSLGVIAEYLGTALSISMGRPLYLVVSRPPLRAGSRQ